MIFKVTRDIKFSYFYRKLNIFSSILIILSILVLLLKGLNLGVDFKGGTLIELRTENSTISIAEIRQSFLKMNLGDVTVKKFGKQNDYLVKIEVKLGLIVPLYTLEGPMGSPLIRTSKIARSLSA